MQRSLVGQWQTPLEEMQQKDGTIQFKYYEGHCGSTYQDWDFTKSHLGNIEDLAHCSSNDPGKDQPGE